VRKTSGKCPLQKRRNGRMPLRFHRMHQKYEIHVDLCWKRVYVCLMANGGLSSAFCYQTFLAVQRKLRSALFNCQYACCLPCPRRTSTMWFTQNTGVAKVFLSHTWSSSPLRPWTSQADNYNGGNKHPGFVYTQRRRHGTLMCFNTTTRRSYVFLTTANQENLSPLWITKFSVNSK
jgi:hypothetical protein